MKTHQKPIDTLESAWMEDIKNDLTQSDSKAMERLKGTLLTDQSLKKAHPLSIRIPDADLEAIQIKAAKAGIPYQTLIKSILHKFATNQLEA